MKSAEIKFREIFSQRDILVRGHFCLVPRTKATRKWTLQPPLCYSKTPFFIDSQSLSWLLVDHKGWHKVCSHPPRG